MDTWNKEIPIGEPPFLGAMLVLGSVVTRYIIQN